MSRQGRRGPRPSPRAWWRPAAGTGADAGKATRGGRRGMRGSADARKAGRYEKGGPRPAFAIVDRIGDARSPARPLYCELMMPPTFSSCGFGRPWYHTMVLFTHLPSA